MPGHGHAAIGKGHKIDALIMAGVVMVAFVIFAGKGVKFV